MHPFGRVTIASHLLPVAAWAFPPARIPLLASWGLIQGAFMVQLLRAGGETFAPNVQHLEDAGDRVALTFDDGPAGEETESLLEALSRSGARATFFFIGRRARNHARLVRRVAEEGHGIGNHTLTHPYHWAAAGRRRVLAEVGEAQKILSDITGIEPRWFRPPMGHKNVFLDEALRLNRLTQVTWSLRSYDTVLRDADRVRRRVLSRIRRGDIVLLHEGLRAKGSGESVAQAVLGGILEELNRRGLGAVSLPGPRQGPAGSSPDEDRSSS